MCVHVWGGMGSAGGCGVLDWDEAGGCVGVVVVVVAMVVVVEGEWGRRGGVVWCGVVWGWGGGGVGWG